VLHHALVLAFRGDDAGQGPLRPIERRLRRQLRAVHKAAGLFRVRSESFDRTGRPASLQSCHAVVLRIEEFSYRLRGHADLLPTLANKGILLRQFQRKSNSALTSPRTAVIR
jgi:hypothetical protein